MGNFEQFYYMNEESECIITSMIETKCFDEAVEFIEMTLGQRPDSSVLKVIIHEVLVKASNPNTVLRTFSYLSKFLDFYPPNDSNSQKYYYDALTGGGNLWSTLASNIRKCIAHCDGEVISVGRPRCDDEIPTSNNKFLLQYFVKVLSVDFENFSSQRSSHFKIHPKNQCLVARLFWPNGEVISMKSSVQQLLLWIDQMYKKDLNCEKRSFVLQQLHDLLCLLGKFCLFYEGCSEAEAVHCQRLDDVAMAICRLCCDTFETYEKLKIFLILMTSRWLRLRICENLMHKAIYHSWLPYGRTAPLTLRKIVRQYMFPPPCNRYVYKSTNKDAPMRKAENRNHKGETDLHIACKKNAPGTLLELLTPDSDINAQDYFGWTPLHEACLASSYICVHVLCNQSSCNEKVNFHAVSNDGDSALHCAVQVNSITIADILLEHGGPTLLELKNNEGKTPADYATSEELKNHFKKYKMTQIASIKEAKNIHNVDDSGIRMPPSMRDEKSYSIYLLLLQYLLTDYIQIFKLTKVKRKNISLFNTIMEYLKTKCGFLLNPTMNDIVARFDDLIWMEQASIIVAEFLKLLTDQLEQEKINIPLPLMQFGFVECLVEKSNINFF